MNRPARLRIWGRPNAESTPALKALCEGFPQTIRERISWEGEYANEQIVPRVFNHVDAIVVPSIWLENSPLVIHEAQQARVPVITADAGGMAEFVQHEVNGLLFHHRDQRPSPFRWPGSWKTQIWQCALATTDTCTPKAVKCRPWNSIPSKSRNCIAPASAPGAPCARRSAYESTSLAPHLRYEPR